jgi:hypothetical protein
MDILFLLLLLLLILFQFFFLEPEQIIYQTVNDDCYRVSLLSFIRGNQHYNTTME